MGRVRREQENYISGTASVNRSQKAYAKDAIIWLLARSPHTEVEISEHFGLPREVVSMIANELVKSGRIIRLSDSPSLFALKDPFQNIFK
ncbi:MAG: helix-turn-helix domain-containing protein [Firmicutes bacterium]|nr:helix-turn-helix domain-containing protein [Bacillota bacterium]